MIYDLFWFPYQNLAVDGIILPEVKGGKSKEDRKSHRPYGSS
jgi:hypothetical protein